MIGLGPQVRSAAGRIIAPDGRRVRCSVGYRVHGDPDRPVILVLGGISADSRVANDGEGPGWWANLVGPGRAVDPDRWCVVGIDYLGGRGTSVLEGCLPSIHTLHQAEACRWVLRHLGRERVHGVVGSSYGGMVALALAEAFPDVPERLVVIGAAHRPHPMATGLRSLQRRIVRLGLRASRERDGLAIARGLAMTTYRSALEFEQRFPSTPGQDARFDVEAYLEHCGDTFAETFAADNFLQLSESIDLHAVTPERIRTPATIVAFDTDAIAPPWLMRELAGRLGAPVRIVELTSLFGHDAFLKEADALGPVLVRALEVQDA